MQREISSTRTRDHGRISAALPLLAAWRAYKMSRRAKIQARMAKSENERRKMDILESFPAFRVSSQIYLKTRKRRREKPSIVSGVQTVWLCTTRNPLICFLFLHPSETFSPMMASHYERRKREGCARGRANKTRRTRVF